ncbi:DUF4386 domain-containing protein [Oceanobacillus arenosus]|uniref:DUF4386 domain-containing protein n=1 Tax=Oceanobacillus arenosus TaxID=1229153 RepID=A0A3D8PJZ0_9BACI|nr:DUF4386 domain-containing protein [Oceanobacillus arenosus]RDW15807.1 DUF4386 domain-containing protein [Oceanobacillus arenosus]
MTITETEQSDRRKTAFIIGVSLIIMAIVSGFSYAFVHESLVVQSDPSTTYQNIMASRNLFKAEIFGWLIILISDIVVAWAIYIFLAPINKSLALLSGWLRLIYSAILGIAILNLIFVLVLSSSNVIDYLSLLETEQVQALMMMSLEGFELIWSIGIVIFGGHLLVVGYVALKSNTIPKIISILLLLASIGYIVIHLSETFLPQYDSFIAILNFIFILPMIVGELGFGIWLLIRGEESRPLLP